MRPYYDNDGITIYHAESLQALSDLEVSIDGLVTDPPYSSGGATRGDRMGSTVSKYVNSDTIAYRPDFAGDNRDQRGYLAWLSLWLSFAGSLARAGAPAAIFTDWRQLPVTTDALQAGGWVWRGIAAWDKTNACRPTLGGLAAQCEFVAWGTRGPTEAERNPVALPGVMKCPSPRGEGKWHIAEKPQPVMSWLVQLVAEGGVLLDPFMGSGSTLVAAKANRRSAIGIEVEERYCEIAAKRLEQGVLDFTSPTSPTAPTVQAVTSEAL